MGIPGVEDTGFEPVYEAIFRLRLVWRTGCSASYNYLSTHYAERDEA
jgi:hypothetical protein